MVMWNLCIENGILATKRRYIIEFQILVMPLNVQWVDLDNSKDYYGVAPVGKIENSNSINSPIYTTFEQEGTTATHGKKLSSDSMNYSKSCATKDRNIVSIDKQKKKNACRSCADQRQKK